MPVMGGNITGLSHIAIAVKKLEDAAAWLAMLPVIDSHEYVSNEQMVKALVVNTAFATFEFLEPLNNESPISRFLDNNPNGGVHHICFKTLNMETSLFELKRQKVRAITRGNTSRSVLGNPISFLNPRDLNGVLVELEEVQEHSSELEKN